MKHVEVKAGRTIQTPSNALKPKVEIKTNHNKKK